jgi:hypothetical protein
MGSQKLRNPIYIYIYIYKRSDEIPNFDFLKYYQEVNYELDNLFIVLSFFFFQMFSTTDDDLENFFIALS